VVLSADHPGLKLGDLLQGVCGGELVGRDLAADVQTELAAARGERPGLEFMEGRIDTERVGLAGHSAGGSVVGALPDVGNVIIPMAARGVEMGSAVQSVLVMGGTEDSVVPYDEQVEGYMSSPSPKRLIGLEGAGHLAFANLCSLRNAAGEDLVSIALESGVCGVDLAGALFQCGPELLADPQAWKVIDYATTAAFEETLQCRDATAAFGSLESRFETIFEFREG
jgi:predicted dienelactone hydrolase